MKILIVAATFAEISPLMVHFQLKEENWISTEKFDICITGVGMVATAFSLARQIKEKYSLILNVGIAGAFDDSFKLGDVVNITQDCFAELGAEDHNNFIPLAELGFGETNYLANNHIDLALPRVKGITVNKVHGNAQSILEITKRLSPQVESMEGAAVFYVAEQLHIPSLQVRSISNWIEPRNQDRWQIVLAISNLNTWLIDFLKIHLNDSLSTEKH